MNRSKGRGRVIKDNSEPEAKRKAALSDPFGTQLAAMKQTAGAPATTTFSFPMSGISGSGKACTEEVHIPDGLVGLIIGRGGEQVSRIQAEAGCKVQVAPDNGTGKDRPCYLQGSKDSIERAKELIMEIVSSKSHEITKPGAPSAAAKQSLAPIAPGSASIEMTIPRAKVGLIIGKGGETIRSLQDKSGTKMYILQENMFEECDKPLRIVGEPDLVEHARQLVMDLITEKPPKPEYMGKQKGGNNEYGGPGGGGGGPSTFQTPPGLETMKGGEMIKRIQMETGAKVQFDPINSTMGDLDEQLAIITGKSNKQTQTQKGGGKQPQAKKYAELLPYNQEEFHLSCLDWAVAAHPNDRLSFLKDFLKSVNEEELKSLNQLTKRRKRAIVTSNRKEKKARLMDNFTGQPVTEQEEEVEEAKVEEEVIETVPLIEAAPIPPPPRPWWHSYRKANIYAFDCEFVRSRVGNKILCASICIVNYGGEIIYKTKVRHEPNNIVINSHEEKIHGFNINSFQSEDCKDEEEVKQDVMSIFSKGKDNLIIIIGSKKGEIYSDFDCLKLEPSYYSVFDLHTHFFKYKKNINHVYVTEPISLKRLCKHFFNVDMQKNNHDVCEDSLYTMKLFREIYPTTKITEINTRFDSYNKYSIFNEIK